MSKTLITQERVKQLEPVIDGLHARKEELDSMHIFTRLAAKDELQKTGVCAISGQSSKLTNCPFCGKLVQEKFVSRKRRDPRDPTKFHPVCDRCNTAYIERKELGPYLASVAKLQKAVNNRKFDCDALSQVDTEIADQISRHSEASEDDAKFARLETQKTKMSMELNQLTREVQNLVSKERDLSDEVLRLDRVFEDKWKLLNEM